MIKTLKTFLNEMASIEKKKNQLFVNNIPLKNIPLEKLNSNIAILYIDYNNFIFPKGYTMVWFFDDDKYIKNFSDGKEDLLYFPKRNLGNAMSLSPINDIWLKNKGNQKHIIGIIEANCNEENIIIKMMSVRKGYMKNGINKHMIDTLIEKFPNAKLCFHKPTEMGERFINKYFPDAKKIL